jgi:Kef-type K+ transport system membrane component KefB
MYNAGPQVVVQAAEMYSAHGVQFKPLRKTIRFTAITIWIIFSRTYDACCTYQLTPDLSKEANPLVSVLGMGWTPLLMVMGMLCLYAIYAFYVSVFRPVNLLPDQENLSFRDVSTYVYLGRTDTWMSVFYKYPKDIGRLNQVVGHVMTNCLVYAGMVSTVMWLLINNSNYYKEYHSVAMIYSLLVLGCIVIIYRWFRSMYRYYLERNRWKQVQAQDSSRL